jgi:hypothetical protein
VILVRIDLSDKSVALGHIRDIVDGIIRHTKVGTEAIEPLIVDY